ncbi:MAG TPA: SHOCT domain-containing protein [Streptosporangiaceae bacterium]|jgi:hypothetical protein
MVGKDKHQWSATQGTIVDVRAGRHEHRYLIDARNQSGAMIQHEVKHRSPQPYSVGSTVRVEISVLNEIRFDPNVADPLVSSMTVADQIAEASAAFDRPGAVSGPSFGLSGLGAGSGTVSFATYSNTSGAAAGLGGMPDGMAGMSQGLAGLASAIGAMVGSATTHVIGPDGRELQVDPAEMQRLTQALTSGDNAERMEAMKQLHRIKAAAMTHVAQGAADGTLGQAGGLAAGGSVQDRLAKLEDLLSKGILTQSEYDTQRQRIIEGI